MDILVFLHYMRLAVGNCCLTGGAVLAEIIYQNAKCQFCCSQQFSKIQEKRSNTDIDFFVPRFPEKLNECYGQRTHEFYERTSLEEGPIEFFDSFKYQILPWFNRAFKSSVKGKLKIVQSRGPPAGEVSNYYYNVFGIHQIVELKFKNSEQKLEIIVLESMPEMKEDWCTFVISAFDIDIVQNRIDDLNLSGKPSVGFIDDTAALSFQSSSFVYTVRPMECFETGFQRICKYMKRGFTLRKIVFDSRLLPFWKHYWLGRFWLLFTKTWTLDLLNNAIKRKLLFCPKEDKIEEVATLNKLLYHVEQNKDVCGLIGSFLWVPPTKASYLKMKEEQKNLEKIRQRFR